MTDLINPWSRRLRQRMQPKGLPLARGLFGVIHKTKILMMILLLDLSRLQLRVR